jgi:hypothetical protein
MAEWQSFNPSDLIPSEIVGLASACSTVGDQLAIVLDTAAMVLDVAKNFVSGFSDPLATVTEALQDLILSMVQAFTQTGIYMLKHAPLSAKIPATPSRWLRDVAYSLDDLYDEERPILVDENAYVGAVVFLATSQYYKDLMSLFNNMLKLFGMVGPTLDQIASWKNVGDPLLVIPGVGRAPDWESKRMIDFMPDLGKIVDLFLNFSNSVAAAQDASSLYGLFADQLSMKAEALRAISDDVTSLVEKLTENMGFEGAYMLPIYGQGDKTWLQQQLVNSTGGPMDLPDAQFSLGVVFLATGGTSEPADLLFTLMGLETE